MNANHYPRIVSEHGRPPVLKLYIDGKDREFVLSHGDLWNLAEEAFVLLRKGEIRGKLEG